MQLKLGTQLYPTTNLLAFSGTEVMEGADIDV